MKDIYHPSCEHLNDLELMNESDSEQESVFVGVEFALCGTTGADCTSISQRGSSFTLETLYDTDIELGKD